MENINEETMKESRELNDKFNELINNLPDDMAEEVACFITEHGAIIGASAVIGLLLRNQDLSGLKGFGKVCAGLGIVGLAGAAGAVAGDSMKKKTKSFFSFGRKACSFLKGIFTPDYKEEEVEEAEEASAT